MSGFRMLRLLCTVAASIFALTLVSPSGPANAATHAASRMTAMAASVRAGGTVILPGTTLQAKSAAVPAVPSFPCTQTLWGQTRQDSDGNYWSCVCFTSKWTGKFRCYWRAETNPNKAVLNFAWDSAIESANRKAQLWFQTDGNLVVYDENDRPRWASNTVAKHPVRTTFQRDGNLVAYTAAGVPVWASKTAGHTNAWIVAQPDGNVVIYDANDVAIWSTRTYH